MYPARVYPDVVITIDKEARQNSLTISQLNLL
jgi:hypothetical protein